MSQIHLRSHRYIQVAHGLSLGGIVCEYIKDASGKVYLLSVLRTEWASNATIAAAGGEMSLAGSAVDLYDENEGEGEDVASAAVEQHASAAAKFQEEEAAFAFVEGQEAGPLRYGEDQQYMGTAAAVHPDPLHGTAAQDSSPSSPFAAALFGLSKGRGQALDWAPSGGRALLPTQLSSPSGTVRHYHKAMSEGQWERQSSSVSAETLLRLRRDRAAHSQSSVLTALCSA